MAQPPRNAPAPPRSAPTPPSKASQPRGAPPPPRSGPPPTRSLQLDPGALAARARAQVGQWLESFRRADRFFKMRAAIIGSWVLISAVTLWAACPSSGPSNSLGAEVQVLRDSLVGGQQLLVRNESTDMWTEVVLTLDGGWRYQHKTVRPHDQLVLSMGNFSRQGQTAPRDLKPRRLTIECEQGRAGFDLR